MKEHIIIGIVVAVALGAHVWIFMWIRFKIDEGVITKFLQETGSQEPSSSEVISAHTNIAIKRVCMVCRRSKAISMNTLNQNSWRLN